MYFKVGLRKKKNERNKQNTDLGGKWKWKRIK